MRPLSFAKFKSWWGQKNSGWADEKKENYPGVNTKRRKGLTLIFLFDDLPKLSEAALYQGLSASGELRSELRIFDEIVSPDSGQYARLSFENHQFRWLGVSAPAPQDSVHQPIECSHWLQADKTRLHQHRSHVICWYEGQSRDASEQMIATLRLAGAFTNLGLLGWVDTEAWNCMPAQVLTKTLTPDWLAACRTEVPLTLWTGFVKFFHTEQTAWFCTKGFHRWGMKDFAFKAGHTDADQALSLFVSLFNYVRQANIPLEVGHTAQLGQQRLRFSPVQELAPYMNSPLGTLVVEVI
jgi:hypothetical protein